MCEKHEHQEISYNFESDETVDCRVVEGFAEAGKTGQYFGFMYIGDRKWAIVLFDGDDDPDFFKAEGLEISSPRWVNVDKL